MRAPDRFVSVGSVEAWCWEAGDGDGIVRWCGGRLVPMSSDGTSSSNHIMVPTPRGERACDLGSWVVKMPTGFWVLEPHEFATRFRAMEVVAVGRMVDPHITIGADGSASVGGRFEPEATPTVQQMRADGVPWEGPSVRVKTEPEMRAEFMRQGIELPPFVGAGAKNFSAAIRAELEETGATNIEIEILTPVGDAPPRIERDAEGKLHVGPFEDVPPGILQKGPPPFAAPRIPPPPTGTAESYGSIDRAQEWGVGASHPAAQKIPGHRYVRKPVTVHALEASAIIEAIKTDTVDRMPWWVIPAYGRGTAFDKLVLSSSSTHLLVRAPGAIQDATGSDMVVRGPDGDLSVMTRADFDVRHDAVVAPVANPTLAELEPRENRGRPPTPIEEAKHQKLRADLLTDSIKEIASELDCEATDAAIMAALAKLHREKRQTEALLVSRDRLLWALGAEAGIYTAVPKAEVDQLAKQIGCGVPLLEEIRSLKANQSSTLREGYGSVMTATREALGAHLIGDASTAECVQHLVKEHDDAKRDEMPRAPEGSLDAILNDVASSLGMTSWSTSESGVFVASIRQLKANHDDATRKAQNFGAMVEIIETIKTKLRAPACGPLAGVVALVDKFMAERDHLVSKLADRNEANELAVIAASLDKIGVSRTPGLATRVAMLADANSSQAVIVGRIYPACEAARAAGMNPGGGGETLADCVKTLRVQRDGARIKWRGMEATISKALGCDASEHAIVEEIERIKKYRDAVDQVAAERDQARGGLDAASKLIASAAHAMRCEPGALLTRAQELQTNIEKWRDQVCAAYEDLDQDNIGSVGTIAQRIQRARMRWKHELASSDHAVDRLREERDDAREKSAAVVERCDELTVRITAMENMASPDIELARAMNDELTSDPGESRADHFRRIMKTFRDDQGDRERNLLGQAEAASRALREILGRFSRTVANGEDPVPVILSLVDQALLDRNLLQQRIEQASRIPPASELARDGLKAIRNIACGTTPQALEAARYLLETYAPLAAEESQEKAPPKSARTEIVFGKNGIRPDVIYAPIGAPTPGLRFEKITVIYRDADHAMQHERWHERISTRMTYPGEGLTLLLDNEENRAKIEAL